jgi:hypothetical protein
MPDKPKLVASNTGVSVKLSHFAIAGFACFFLVVTGLFIAVVGFKDSEKRETRKKAIEGNQAKQAKMVKTQSNYRERQLQEEREQEAKAKKEAEEAERIRLAMEAEYKLHQEINEEIKRLKKQDLIERIGRLSAIQRFRAERALQMVNRAGDEGFDRLPQSVIEDAALLDPDLIREKRRISGEKYLKKLRAEGIIP